MLSALPDMMIEPVVRAALLEDLGRMGDITSAALVDPALQWRAALRARKAGVLAGVDTARLAFTLYDSAVRFEAQKADGEWLEAGDTIAVVEGPARSLLAAERTALNFISHLSGVATATRSLVDAAAPHKARICCTRKTTPGLRTLEKAAVRAGGGMNHRLGLDDAILIKDNHIAVCGDLRAAVAKARAAAGHMVKIEVEVDTLDQLRILLDLKVDAVLLDNMTPDRMAEAVRMVGGRMLTEASGNVTASRVQAIAAAGVDMISSGWITHSAPILDIGLDAL